MQSNTQESETTEVPDTNPTPLEEETSKSDTHEATNDSNYLSADSLLVHIQRQARILREALQPEQDKTEWSATTLSHMLERELFTRSNAKFPAVPKQSNGSMSPDPRLNFYPAFMVPEALATYHPFFVNQRIPLSCRANRPLADKNWELKDGSRLPDIVTVQEQPRFFESLQGQELSRNQLEVAGSDSETGVLTELEGDSPRLAVVKRCLSVTHAAYPALGLPPKVSKIMSEELTFKTNLETGDNSQPVVSDEQLQKWLKAKDPADPAIEEHRKRVMAVTLITCQLEALRSFFSRADVIRRVGESLHYLFQHGYVKQAIQVCQTDLTHLVTYMGIVHENRLGQTVLHGSLLGEARRDYIRDTVYLFLIYTWQTAMGVWQQCLEDENLEKLRKILQSHRRSLYTETNERLLAAELRRLVFPAHLENTLAQGLPDILHQSIINNFRSFILERSGILPATTCAYPSDFVPTTFKECPPPLWAHTYLLTLANYFMYHNDLQEDLTGAGLLSAHCRCNLCSPHRSLVHNTALLNEVKCINTFELQGPPGKDGKSGPCFKLTPGLWVSAYLRKFEEQDYHPYSITYFENSKKQQPKTPLSACVLTQTELVAQLLAINDHRREFLHQKGRGVYLDPQTGEEIGKGSADPASLSDSDSHAEDREGQPTAGAGRRGRVERGRVQRRQRQRPGGHFIRGGRSSPDGCSAPARERNRENEPPALECDCHHHHHHKEEEKESTHSMGLSSSTEHIG
ncbi:100K [Murine mastadenovirus A]|uniref:100K protein n=1 Tax=Murine adenovirus A serotype 1 TaxID=10530 RepID=Q83111_ADEM1|nr:100K protein [Murine mastadenovirus A]AP_000354.1 100K [Murine mastadenovirus A]AAB88713.1 100K protein [Murine adenovirus 1]